MKYTLGELAEHVGARVVGNADCVVEGVGSLDAAGPAQITFLSSSRYRKFLAETHAGAVILTDADAEICPVNALVVADPYLAYARIAQLLTRRDAGQRGKHQTSVVNASASVHETAWIGAQCVVEAGAVIGAHVVIGPGCLIGEGVHIGERSRLVANVTVCHGSMIGKRAVIHPGVVIGADGFGFANDKGTWVKVPQLGAVRIGDDVEIGANTTVDRGAVADTVIEDGVKLDNQIQVAHNVRIGAHTAIAACTGISGSTVIGRHCMIAGGVGIGGHLEIADNVVITGMAMVTKSIKEPGVYSSGVPAEPNQRWHKSIVRFRQLDDMARRLKELEKRLESFEKQG